MKKLLVALLGLVFIALAAAGAAAWWAWRTLHRPHQGYTGEERVVVVEPGTPAGEILTRLEAEGVIADARLARLYLVHVLEDPPLRAGEYGFAGPRTTPEVLLKLIRGEVVTHPVTVIEGLTLRETAETLAAQGFGDLDRFLAAMASPAAIADLDPEATDLEGYLFPDTYSFARGTTEREIVATLVRTFRERWAAEVDPLLAAAGPTGGEPGARDDSAVPGSGKPLPGVREIVTLASVVEKEARLDAERPIVAGVYRNRLDRGIPLQADPTVIFALKRLGTWDGNLRRPDLALDSPYNTYRYPGLPPGPIASPGLASFEAAAQPAAVPYLYFVSRNDGSHVFAETLAEHNRNVQRWQVRYWRERWARERAERQAEGEGNSSPEGDQGPR